jgi:hypothetical protein
VVDFRERRSKLERGGVQAALGIFQLRAERRRLIRIGPVARRGDPSHREEPRQHRKNVSGGDALCSFVLAVLANSEKPKFFSFLGRTDRDLSRDLSGATRSLLCAFRTTWPPRTPPTSVEEATTTPSSACATYLRSRTSTPSSASRPGFRFFVSSDPSDAGA